MNNQMDPQVQHQPKSDFLILHVDSLSVSGNLYNKSKVLQVITQTKYQVHTALKYLQLQFFSK